MTLADILVVMNGGKVEQIGNPLDIYQKPATTFVASFIGAPPINLMPLRSDELKSQLAGDTRINEAGILGIRPEAFVITNETVSGGIALGLTIEAIERVGAKTLFTAPGSRRRRASPPPRRTAPGRNYGPDSRRDRPRHRRANQGGGRSRRARLFSADGRKRVGR